VENAAILIELPPVGKPEAVLLGEGVPHLIWLVRCGMVPAGEVRRQVQTLRLGGCRVVGAALNFRDP
jgi:hypothetical protein